MRVEIKHLQRRLATTSLYVTHDQLEAMTLGDRLVVLNGGKIEQVGSPMDVYNRPQTLFVASFIGSPAMNMLGVDFLREKGQGAALNGLGKDTGLVGMRPDDMLLTPPEGAHLALTGRLELLEPAGAESHLYLSLDGGSEPYVMRVNGQPHFDEGQAIDFYVSSQVLHPFNPTTGQRTN